MSIVDFSPSSRFCTCNATSIADPCGSRAREEKSEFFAVWVFTFACGCFIVFLVINQWSMLHVMDCEYWLCLLMFMKNVTTCSFGFVFVYGHFVCRGHCVS